MNKRKVTRDIAARIIAEREQGVKIQVIADKYGVSPSAVYRYYHASTQDLPEHNTTVSFTEKFAEEWNKARGDILGYRIGWPEEWDEARKRVLKIIEAEKESME